MENFFANLNYEVIPFNKNTNVRFYTSIDTGSYVPPHWHDALEIIYLKEGTVTFTIENKVQKLVHGQCILINPNIIHSTQCTEPNTAIVFQIPIKFLASLIPDVQQKFLCLDYQEGSIVEYEKKITTLKNTLSEMQFLNDNRHSYALLRFNSLLYDVILQLYQGFSIQIFHNNFEHKKHVLDQLTPILNYTAQHYKEPISIQEISNIASLQPTYFCRFFKKTMGITFLEYRHELQLSHILKDLVSSTENIGLILERHGFTNYKLFCKIFHKHFDATPSQMRKKLRKTVVSSPGKKGD